MTTLRVARSARRRRRRIVYWIAALALALVCATLALALGLRGDADLSFSSETVPAAFSGRLLTVLGGIAKIWTARGRLLREIQTPGADRIAVGTRVAAVYGESVVYVLSRAGRLSVTLTSADPIEQVACGASATAVMTRTDAGIFIQVYDNYGNRIDAVGQSVFGDDTVAEMGLEGTRLYVLALDTSGVVPASRIVVFDVSSRATLADVVREDDVVTDVLLTDDGFLAIGNAGAVCYNQGGAQTAEFAAAGNVPVLAATMDGVPVVVYRRIDGDGARVLYGDGAHGVALNVVSAAVCGKRLVLVDEGGDVYVFNPARGTLRALELDGAADAVVADRFGAVLRLDGRWRRVFL